ncbi:MAG: outer membrane protein assembly factor BamA [Nitrospirota bacterium]|nr:outer membrane protein assembly factor BamA [Nitrospirota bacterium]
MRKTVLLVIVLLLASYTGLFAQAQPLVNAIEVKGLKRIEEGAVKAKLSQKLGEPISQEKTNEDIKSIFKLGYFEDVKVEIEAFEGGVKLFYRVREKPAIIRIELQGNKKIEDSKIREKISITPGSIADTVLIQDNAIKIGKYYEEEGYWLTNIIPVIKKISENEVTLTYQIEEGDKVKIKKISVEGNKYLSAGKIKKAMETKEWWLFSFIGSGGYLKKDQLDADMERVRNLYFNNGFLKVVVGEPEIVVDKEKKGMIIKLHVSEGDQYRVASLDVKGNKLYDADTIRKKITLKQNSLFQKNILEKDMLAVSDLYSRNGYALVSVVPDLTPDENKKTVQIVLGIEEGDKYHIGRVEISGNLKTRDKVIRREIRLDEGETFDSSKLKRSYERINNLGFFEAVDMVPKPKYEDKSVDLDVKVKERPTGFISVGGGYSSADGFIATADITQGNLFGKGQYIKVKGELGGKTSYYELSFRDPYFRDKPISLSTGLYRHHREYIEYNKQAYGFYIGLGKSFDEYWKGDITYNFEKATIDNIKEGASSVVADQEGTSTTSSITPTITRDSRDNFLDPSRGSRNSLTVTLAGLGGSNGFVKTVVDSGWFFPVTENTTFMARGRLGYSKALFGKKLPLYERFYVGGINTIRGLSLGEAGPRDVISGDPIGGTTELIFNFEYIFPLSSEMKLKGLVFIDAGNAYDNFNKLGDLRYTSGLGVRWISPFGPIRLEWGYNLAPKFDESASKFEFAFGSFF